MVDLPKHTGALLIVGALGLALITYLARNQARAAGVPARTIRRGLVHLWLGSVGVIVALALAGTIVGFDVTKARPNELLMAAPLVVAALGLFLWVRSIARRLMNGGRAVPAPPDDREDADDEPEG
jgi:hypothetical protein